MRHIRHLLAVVGFAGNLNAQVTMLDNGGGTQLVGPRSSVTIGGDGLPLIAYLNAASRTIRLAHCLKADCTVSELSSPFSAGEEDSYEAGAGLATAANGLGVLAWMQANVGLRFAICSDARCSTASVKTLDSFNPGDASRVAVVVRTDGRPFIAYWYGPSGDLRIADCGNAACETVAIRTVDAAGQTGGSPSVVLRSDSTPLISYYDYTNGDLRLADCTNVDCSSWNLSTVDSTGDVGNLSSIAFTPTAGWSIAYQAQGSVKYANGGDSRVIEPGNATLSYTGMSLRFGQTGLPILAVFTSNVVRVIRCPSASCVTFESHDVPTLGQVLGDFSMAVGADGLPVIPFYGQPPSGLYVAHCWDEACQYVTSPPPADYYSVTPCRLYDSRLGSPGPLLADETRSIAAVGSCDIPTGVSALALNITVTQPSASGNLRLYPSGQSVPLASTLNYSAGQTRGNNAVAGTSASGSFSVYCSQASGSAHVIVDVSGYFK